MTARVSPIVEQRARRSEGTSNEAILNMVMRALEQRRLSGGCLADVGCGQGDLYGLVRSRFSRYVGLDAARYEHFPEGAEFGQIDLDTGEIPMPANSADVVTAIEVIEHLENPRDFMRKLVRLARPGGWVIVTTPNQLSLLSLVTLAVKHRFQAFQDIHYPAHLTALLEVDLRRIAGECGLEEIEISFSKSGRLPFTARYYPRALSLALPRRFSDNVLLIGRKSMN